MSLGKLIGFLVFAVSLYILWQIRQVLLLVFAAVIFAVVLNRIVRWLQRGGVKRGIALALTIISLVGILFILFALVGPSFAQQLEQLGSLAPISLESLRNWVNSLSNRLPERLINVRSISDFLPRLQPLITGLLNNAYI